MTDNDAKQNNEKWVCPASHAGFLVARVRKMIQNPSKILKGLIEEGQTAADLGCGPGYFTIPMAEMVGETGCVLAVDLQQGMLDMLSRRAQEAGMDDCIRPVKCGVDRLGLDVKIDFVLAFYMVHEVPDAGAFLAEVFDALKPGGRMLYVEPKLHVPAKAFEEALALAREAGFGIAPGPKVCFSRSALLEKS